MKVLALRGLLVVAALAVVAAAATPAQATLTPVNARVSATSSDTQLRADDGSLTVTCPTSEVTATISADGRSFSGTVAFSRGKGRTCLSSGLFAASPVEAIVCRITVRSVSSVAGTSASGDLVTETSGVAPAPCSVDFPAVGITIHVDNQTVRNCITFNQATQSLAVNCRLTVTAPPLGSRTATFTGNYSINTVNGRPGRITIS